MLSAKDLFKSITNIELHGSGTDLIAEVDRRLYSFGKCIHGTLECMMCCIGSSRD